MNYPFFLHKHPLSAKSCLYLGVPFLLLAGLVLCVVLPQPALGKELRAPYTVTFEGLKDKGLRSSLKKTARTVQLEDNPPATPGLVRRRAQRDIPGMIQVLKAQGFYEAAIEIEVKQGGEQDPLQVRFMVHPGPIYTIQDVHIRLAPPAPSPAPDMPTRQDLGLPRGHPAKADLIRQAKSALESRLKASGYVLARLEDPTVTLKPETNSVDLMYTLHPGPKALFGPSTIQGLSTVRKDYVQSFIPWKRNEVFDPDQVRSLKERLLQTGLFNMVQVSHPQEVNASNQLPMTITLHEVDHKQVSFSIGYETDTGPQVSAAWEHLNLLGRGKQLLVGLDLSQVNQELQTSLIQNHIWDRDLDLILQGSVFREDTEAYTSSGGKASAHIQSQVSKAWSLGLGLAYKGKRIDDQESEETFHQFSLPAFAQWDTRDSVLNPVQGGTMNLHLNPMAGLLGQKFTLFKSSLSTRWYFDLLSDSGQAVLALRGKAGSLLTSEIEDIPADERWYAGGGGSIRGYPYQEVGPHEEGDPVGGRSLLETSAEMRWKWTESIGSVLFVDAGNVTDSMIPDPSEKLYWGAGLGARYYTAVGPLRLDVAFPLTSDPNIDDSFQIYVSLGQAF